MKHMAVLEACGIVFCLSFSLYAGRWDLVWADSFNTYTGLPDPTKWAYETGAGGWGNNELENYTANRLENARVDSGNLIIEARNDNYQNSQYSSVRMHSIGTGNWTYGRMEIRAKLPFGKGTWPALWMMPTSSSYGGWPASGEIDIMEHVGSDQGNIHFSTHCLKYYFRLGNQKTAIKMVADCSTAFHVYAMEWTPDTIRGYVDTSLYFINPNEHSGWQAWPFDKPFHFIFNIAIGGDWGGTVDNSIFPQRMYVDYAKVYTWNPTGVSGVRTGDISSAAARTLCDVIQTHNGLQISLPSSGSYEASLCATNGRIVSSARGSGASCALGVAGLTRGVYVLKITGTWGKFNKRIALQN
jgi:beta-glucanase (GH16 family)